ncbi:MAG: chorismate-binding protein [Phycisphaerales bacterium]|nr:chorismate-binding protein [Phycisphaerales bacterium]
MANLNPAEFESIVARERAASGTGTTIVVPLAVRLIADQLTPTIAYRRLVAPDDRAAPSFLLESVEGGERQGRYSILGARPRDMFLAKEGEATHRDLRGPDGERAGPCEDPFEMLRAFSRERRLAPAPGTPGCVLGGLFGYAAYDSVRYANPGKLPWDAAPPDDLHLPDLCFAYYDTLVVFDHAQRSVYVIALADVGPREAPGGAYAEALARLDGVVRMLDEHSEPLRTGFMPGVGAAGAATSNLTRAQHASMVDGAMGYIRAGDVFQVVLGQRFERTSDADPFDVYRALRCVNPSPYMVYMQCEGCVLVASSPEILCRVRRSGAGLEVTNRPLAGTRRRGRTVDEDSALERELLADPKERAEHIMLVDLGRNDVGVVAQPGTVRLPAVMEVERYSHVMHISSTVTGVLRDGLDCWDALRAALPVGTISGAPKVRAMQVIDELEPVRRGPYGGGIGYVGLDGQMDVALTLRTMVVPLARVAFEPGGARRWTYLLQASGGIVADSDTEAEYQETVNKAAGLGRAVDVAEAAFMPNKPLSSGPNNV